MRRAVLIVAVAVLLAAPTVLAFYSGGYFDEPRLIATIAIWALVLIAAIVGTRPLPGARPGRVAIGGLALVTAWTGLSITWAPLAQPATASFVRMLMYLGALIAAAALLRERSLRRAVEPALALGALVVIGYGLAGRFLAGILKLSQSATADGRLEQPITYWNAEGALAAIGLVLCARLAGDRSRPAAMRAAAAAAAVPLGLGVYLSFSRGAIAAAIVGLVVLLAVAPTYSQLRAALLAAAGAVLVAALSAVLPENAVVLAVLLVAMAAAAFAAVRLVRREAEGSPGEAPAGGAPAGEASARRAPAGGAPAAEAPAGEAPAGEAPAGGAPAGGAPAGEARADGGAPHDRLPWARRIPAVAVGAVAIGLVVLIAAGLSERTDENLSQRRGAARLASVESQRYEYWRVGIGSVADHPLNGTGAGGFRVVWLRERPTRDTALEVHSLPLEMLVELGIVGLLAFGLFAGGVAAAGARALSERDLLAPGAAAATTVFALHAAIDWDWQLPAVALPAIVLAGGLIAGGERGASASRTDSAPAAARQPPPPAPDRSPA